MGIPLKDGRDYEVPDWFRSELEANYFDVEDELRKMRLWCLANPEKRKTKRGVNRFVLNWLNRAGKLRPLLGPPKRILMLGGITAEDRERNKGRIAELKAVLRR